MKTTMRKRRLFPTVPALFLIVTLTVLPVGAAGSGVSATDTTVASIGAILITAKVGGRTLDDRVGLMIGSTTYVGLRAMCEELDPACRIAWDGAKKTATVRQSDSLGGAVLTVIPGEYWISIGERVFYTVEPILNLDGRLYLPVRPLAKAFGADVSWNESTKTVTVGRARAIRTDAGVYEEYAPSAVYWLSRIISAEAGGEPFRGQIAVGNVVVNRVADPRYPDTIWGVIFDRKYGTQFTPVAIGTVYREPTASAVRAAKAVLEGGSVSETAIFFCNPAISTSTWILRTCTYEFRIGNHVFYR